MKASCAIRAQRWKPLKSFWFCISGVPTFLKCSSKRRAHNSITTEYDRTENLCSSWAARKENLRTASTLFDKNPPCNPYSGHISLFAFLSARTHSYLLFLVLASNLRLYCNLFLRSRCWCKESYVYEKFICISLLSVLTSPCNLKPALEFDLILQFYLICSVCIPTNNSVGKNKCWRLNRTKTSSRRPAMPFIRNRKAWFACRHHQ